MENEHLTIEIDGAEISDLYPRLISLEVEHDTELAAMFRLQFSLLLDQGGSWGILDVLVSRPEKDTRGTLVLDKAAYLHRRGDELFSFFSGPACDFHGPIIPCGAGPPPIMPPPPPCWAGGPPPLLIW